MLPDNASLNLAVPNDGERLDRLHPVFLRRLAAMYAYVGGNASIVDAVREMAEQRALYAKYKAGTGNTAADPDRIIGERTIFQDTPYEVHGIAVASWHVAQTRLVCLMFLNAAGWGFATDWNYGGMNPPTRARFNEAVAWNVPNFRVTPPTWTGLCRTVGPTAKNPDGEWWHVQVDTRVPSTPYDLPPGDDDMTEAQEKKLDEILMRLRWLGGESSEKGTSVMYQRIKKIDEKVDD